MSTVTEPDISEEVLAPTCLNCGGHDFYVAVTASARVLFKESEEHEVIDAACGDVEWDGDSHCRCTNCGWAGRLKETGHA